MNGMDGDTPATRIQVAHLIANRRAAEHCLAAIPSDDVKTILDIRYGLGYWARVAQWRFPKAEITGYEADSETAARAWVGPGVTLYAEKWDTSQSTPADLLLADFNMSTTLSKEPLMEALASVRPVYVVFTDVAAVKIHLNFARYGLRNPLMDEYWKSFDLTGYELITYRREHRAASTALWKRKSPGRTPGDRKDGNLRRKVTPSGSSRPQPSPSR